MGPKAERLLRLLPGLWAGLLWCILLVAAPAPFATLSPADAGRVNGRIFAQEAWISLVLALLLVMVERRRSALGPSGTPVLGPATLLLLGTMFCTLVGYFGVQPMLPAARAGQGAFAFGTLHAVSVAMFVLKTLLVTALAWSASAAAVRPSSS